jgi:hypothetical protein
VNCPYCGLYMSDSSIKACLRCGGPLLGRTSSTLSATAKPGYRRSRKWRNLLIAAVATFLIAACIVSGYYVFGLSGPQTRSLPAIPGPHSVLFSDPLTTNINGWSSDINHCFFQDLAYHVKNNIVCYSSVGSIGDATISVQVKQIAGSLLLPYGLVFRRVSQGNWYEFTIDSTGNWSFSKAANQQTLAIIDSTPSTAIKPGLNTTNTLLVQAKGAHFVFFVNGTQVGQTDDSTFASGEIGLTATGAATEVAFNNIKITN